MRTQHPTLMHRHSVLVLQSSVLAVLCNSCKLVVSRLLRTLWMLRRQLLPLRKWWNSCALCIHARLYQRQYKLQAVHSNYLCQWTLIC